MSKIPDLIAKNCFKFLKWTNDPRIYIKKNINAFILFISMRHKTIHCVTHTIRDLNSFWLRTKFFKIGQIVLQTSDVYLKFENKKFRKKNLTCIKNFRLSSGG